MCVSKPTLHTFTTYPQQVSVQLNRISFSVFLKFSLRLVSIQSGCSRQLLLLAPQMSSDWVAASQARLHLRCEGYVSQTVTRPRNPLCLSPADIHIHVTMPLWPETDLVSSLTSFIPAKSYWKDPAALTRNVLKVIFISSSRGFFSGGVLTHLTPG